ncbi:MAG TPA: hypothetical protein VL172_17795, partial [Kofleriaceae bacterium]|nr:hypothetical protein [Kofleriaceae bacterium]
MRWSLIALTVAAAACGSDPEPPDPAPAFGEPPAGISVFEASYDGFATRGARAALAEPAAEPEIEVGREGSCRLLTFENGSCDPPCDGPCVDGACPAPALHGAGTIAVAGLAV